MRRSILIQTLALGFALASSACSVTLDADTQARVDTLTSATQASAEEAEAAATRAEAAAASALASADRAAAAAQKTEAILFRTMHK